MKTFIIEQKLTVWVNQYSVFEIQLDGKKGNLIAFAQQKRIALKEEITFYNDTKKSVKLFSVKAKKLMDFHGTFSVIDAEGEQLGIVKKAFKASLLRTTWEILDASGNKIVIVSERSRGIAAARRIWEFVPYIGELLPFPLKYHFTFKDAKTNNSRANYVKTTTFRDHYRLDVDDEALIDEVGWQTLVAQAVLLDALQGR